MKGRVLIIFILLLQACTSNEVFNSCGEKKLNKKGVVIHEVWCDTIKGFVSTYERNDDRFNLNYDYYQIGVQEVHYGLMAIDSCLNGISGYKAFFKDTEFFSIKRETDCLSGKMAEVFNGNCIFVLDTTYKDFSPIVTLHISYPEGFTDSIVAYRSCLDCQEKKTDKKELNTKRNFIRFDTTMGSKWKIEVEMTLNSGQKLTCDKKFDWKE